MDFQVFSLNNPQSVGPLDGQGEHSTDWVQLSRRCGHPKFGVLSSEAGGGWPDQSGDGVRRHGGTGGTEGKP